MSYTALYREWRPQNFNDVVSQKHITNTLKNEVKGNKIAHAYLFCGTRGTGKTSTAKIFAKAVNCLHPIDGEPCNKCENCLKINQGTFLDVTELDAASNNGVDKIRDIIDDVIYPPREGKYKVYIMDEVHMLSTGAVNAFLKTLEEPPGYVIFILATTDPQKLPVTILSRCQRFDFKRIKSSEIEGRLRRIVDEKGVEADDRSLMLISRMADGAMRDALSILDQAISMGNSKIEYTDLLQILGLVTNENINNLMDFLIARDLEGALKEVDKIVFCGKDINVVIKDLISQFRNLLMTKITKNPEQVIDASLEEIESLKKRGEKIRVEEIMRDIRILEDSLTQAKWSTQSRIYLELSIMKLCRIEYDTSKETIISRLNQLQEMIKSGSFKAAPVKNEEQKKEKKEPVKVIEKKEEPEKVNLENPKSKITLEQAENSFPDILETIKNKKLMVIYASLVTGEVSGCKNGEITIKYPKEYSFNKERLEKEEYRVKVEEIFSEALKEKVRIKYIVEEEIKKDNEEKLKEYFGDTLEVYDD